MYGEFVNISPSYREEFYLTQGADRQMYLLYLQEGSFSLTVSGASSVIRPGTVVFFSPKTPMERHVIEPIRFLYIRFNGEDLDAFPRETTVYSELSPRATEDLAQLDLLAQSSCGTMGLELKKHYFNDLLLCLVPPPQGRGQMTDLALLPPIPRRAVAYMEQHLRDKLTVGDIAAHCALSPTSLEVLFRKSLGRSVYDYLIFLRMEKAKLQLTQTPYSVGQIALHCGFDNSFYFCNAFKKRFAMTPTQYRKANRI
ncbi:MAG: helix-turn-helix transcriptional regulator [Clostridia bacterium]|nr:helix-turn-helix transcriptional regulator [Clostridia bacterium]